MKRRDVLTGAVKMGTLLGAAPFVVLRRASAATTIAWVGYGGSSGDWNKEHVIKPFTTETGIAVEYAVNPNLASAKAQVESKNILWDIYQGSNYTGEKEGLWEPVDTKLINPARFIQKPPSWGVPDGVYTGGIGYDPSRAKNPPKDFAQFWDVKSFPGRRALRKRVSENLEMALVADGVAPDKLYPLDVDRAFKALDRIKPYVSKWYTATAEGVSLIQRNEADYSFTWANRVALAKASGVSIGFSLDQCIILPEYMSVLKGSPRAEAAMRFLEFITRPEQQIAIVNSTGGTTSLVKGVNEQMDEQVRRWLPDLNSPKMVFYDTQYWGDHEIELTRRFEEWLLT